MSDPFAGHQTGLESPAIRIEEIVPDDGADLARPCRALNVAQAGTVRVTTVAGETGTVYVAAGGVFPIRAARIWATGTTADGIVALC